MQTETKTLKLSSRDLFAERARLAGGRPSFFIETAGKQYLFTDPSELLSIRDGVLTVENAAGRTEIPGNPLVALRERLERTAPGDPGLPAFAHGAVGYLGYDCVQYQEKIAFTGAPAGEDEACFIIFRQVTIADGETITQYTHDLPRAPFLKGTAYLLANARPGLDDAAFTRAVKAVKEHIRQGDIFQCVLSQRFETALTESTDAIFERLRAQGAAPYRYFFETPRQTLLGASPERLVRVQDGIVDTCPIAGTRPRGATPAEDERLARQLRRSPKERAEHLMLVDLSRNDLGRVCRPGSVRVTGFRQLQRFSHVMHLVSTVAGELRADETALGALLAAFPAGTLTGAPKIRAMEILAELEPRRRGAYGGAVVLYDFRGQLESCITIRSLVAQGDRAAVQAGAGLVADSQSARELAEIQHKSRAVRRALQGAL